MSLVKRKWRLWQLSSAEPAWKWDTQRSWPEAFFSQPLALRANNKKKTKSSSCRKICQERIKGSLWEQGTTWKVFPTDFFQVCKKRSATFCLLAPPLKGKIWDCISFTVRQNLLKFIFIVFQGWHYKTIFYYSPSWELWISIPICTDSIYNLRLQEKCVISHSGIFFCILIFNFKSF